MRVRLLCIIVSLTLGGWTCGASNPAQESVTITTSEGNFAFTVELAQTSQERQRGLMGRTSLPSQHGMFFIFPSLSVSPFWMKNTPLSLDIIFVSSEGEIQEIAAETTPNSTELITPQQAYLYVLEVEAGTAEEISLQAGDTITLPE